MNRKFEYIVCRNENVEELCDIIINHIYERWELWGSPFLANGFYCQAMTRWSNS